MGLKTAGDTSQQALSPVTLQVIIQTGSDSISLAGVGRLWLAGLGQRPGLHAGLSVCRAYSLGEWLDEALSLWE